ncbi:MAG: hypothetical protein WA130_19420 [Candidatus Methanoperedens sp.]
MINIKEIVEYFNEISRLYGQKIMVENAELIDFFKRGSFGTACKDVFEDSVRKYISFLINEGL